METDKHIVKCENFQRRLEGVSENNLCRATGTENVPCGGFSDGCIAPDSFTPRDNYPIELVAFSHETSSSWRLMKPSEVVDEVMERVVRAALRVGLPIDGEPR